MMLIGVYFFQIDTALLPCMAYMNEKPVHRAKLARAAWIYNNEKERKQNN